jgi:hypothetical protein
MNPVLLRVWPEGRGRANVAAALVVGALVLFVSGDDDGVIMCPFRRCTGGYCPLCGTTRSVSSLARFDPQTAWSGHPMVVLALMQLIAVGALRLSGRTLSQVLRQRILLGNALLAVVVWGIRLAAGYVPAPNGLRLPF